MPARRRRPPREPARYTLTCTLCGWQRRHVAEHETDERSRRHERNVHAKHRTVMRVAEIHPSEGSTNG